MPGRRTKEGEEVRQTIGTRVVAMARPGGLISYAATAVIAASAVEVATGVATSTIAPSLADKSATAFVYSGAWLTLTHVMVLAGIIGLSATSAARAGWLKHIGFGVAYVGLAAKVLGESVLRFNFDLGNAFFGIAVPATAVGMVLIGFAIFITRTWRGWHRYAALVCGVYVPVVLIPAFVAAKGPSFIALAGWSCCFLAFGVAMRAEERT